MRKWTREAYAPAERQWEEFYRNRWQHDKSRAQHARRELHRRLHLEDPRQGRDRHLGDARARLPCSSRASRPTSRAAASAGSRYSWYLYSPLRVKYPYIRGALLDLWREATNRYTTIRSTPGSPLSRIRERRKRWQQARGKGGFRRAKLGHGARDHLPPRWSTRSRQHGPDRIAGFSPIPAMSMISYAAGAACCS